MRHLAFAAPPFVAACVVGASACAGPNVGACNADADCSGAELCVNGACAVVDAPSIASVDGDGSALAPVTTSNAPAHATNATHRVRDRLVVTGTNLALVDSATLSVSTGNVTQRTSLTVVADDSSEADVRRTILIANVPAAFLGTAVVLAIASPAGTAHADVFLLQGEPGPAGPPGPPAITASSRVASDPTCGGGAGARIDSGPDLDGDGALAANEVTSSVVVCDGASALASPLVCDASTCSLALPLAVPGLSVAGAPVVRAIESATTIHVPADAPTVTAALQAIANARIATDASVTIVVDTSVVEPGIVEIDHPDGARIEIRGANPQVVVTTQELRVPPTSALGGLDNLTLQGDGSSTCLLVLGRATLGGSSLTITQCGGSALTVVDGGFAQARALHIGATSSGDVSVNGGAMLILDDSDVTGGQACIIVGTGASASLTNTNLDSCTQSGLASSGGAAVDVTGGRISGCQFGVDTLLGSVATLSATTLVNNATDVVVSTNGTVLVGNVASAPSHVTDATGVYSGP